MTCESCERDNLEKCYFCRECYFQALSRIQNLSIVQIRNNLTCDELFPETVQTRMGDYLINEVNECLRCLDNGLWTAATCMSARIFENQLKYYVRRNYNRYFESIFACIDFLERMGYPDYNIEKFDSLRRLRNDAMHATYEFNQDDSIYTAKLVFQLTLTIFSSKPQLY